METTTMGEILAKLYAEHGKEPFRTGGIFSRWAGIEDSGHIWDVLFTSEKYSHCGGKAISVSFSKKEGQLGGVYKSAITMWRVNNEGEAKYFYEWASTLLRRAAAPKPKSRIVRICRFLFT